MNVHILGNSPLAQFTAFGLYQSLGNRVHLTLLLESLLQKMIFLERKREAVLTPYGTNIPQTIKLDALYKPFPDTTIENLVVATDAPFTEHLLKQWVPYISSNTNVLLLQNGMGIYEQVLERYFPFKNNRPRFFQGIESHGLERTGTVSTNQYRAGKIDIAELGSHRLVKTPLMIEALLDSSLLNANYIDYPDLLVAQVEKLVVNAVIQPLTAIYDCPNGDLLELESLYDLMQMVVSELLRIIYAGYPELRNLALAQTVINQESLMNTVIEACKVTKSNLSFMRVAMSQKRKTEIEYLNGYLIKLANKVGIQCQYNMFLQNLVKSKFSMARTVDRETLEKALALDVK